MAGTRNATGFARNLLIALAIVLIGGIAGSFWMGIRAKDAVVTSTVTQVQTIADNSLTLVFKPADLSSPATGDRATALLDQVTASVLDTSPFTHVTLWSQDGRILFSSNTGVQPAPVLPISQPRTLLDPPTPGIREEAEARRRAEERARSAEDRLEVLQEQYRKTLEELHTSQQAARDVPQAFRSDPKLEQ